MAKKVYMFVLERDDSFHDIDKFIHNQSVWNYIDMIHENISFDDFMKKGPGDTGVILRELEKKFEENINENKE